MRRARLRPSKKARKGIGLETSTSCCRLGTASTTPILRARNRGTSTSGAISELKECPAPVWWPLETRSKLISNVSRGRGVGRAGGSWGRQEAPEDAWASSWGGAGCGGFSGVRVYGFVCAREAGRPWADARGRISISGGRQPLDGGPRGAPPPPPWWWPLRPYAHITYGERRS